MLVPPMPSGQIGTKRAFGMGRKTIEKVEFQNLQADFPMKIVLIAKAYSDNGGKFARI